MEVKEVFRKAVLTKFKRLGELTYPRDPKPTVVEVKEVFKKTVETNPTRFCVLTRLSRLGVDTNPSKFGVDTRPTRLALLTYPAVPRPLTVDVKEVFRKAVETKLEKLTVER